jgi:hypothetical protein
VSVCALKGGGSVLNGSLGLNYEIIESEFHVI